MSRYISIVLQDDSPGLPFTTMAATTANRAAAAPADDIFDYNADLDDIFRDVDTNMNVPARSASNAPQSTPRGGGAGLGIDEEIKVAKARKPIPKLDEDRFVSEHVEPP